MLFFELIKILWAPFAIHLFVCGLFFTAIWWVIARFYPQLHFRWAPPLLVGCLFSIGWSAHTIVTVYENKLMSDAQQVAQAKATAAQQEQQKAYMQMKSEFLKSVDALVQNPKSISAEAKQKLFEQFKPMFPTNDEKTRAANSIFTAYSCQKFFLQDAVESYKEKKLVKSTDRQACENYDGSFFNREKLLPADVAKANDETLKLIATRQRLPASDGKTEEVTEAKLNERLEAQSQAVEAVKAIFQ